MDHFSEPERLEVISVSSDDEDNGHNTCPNGSSSISNMTSSGICHKFSSEAPANTLAMREINDTEAPGDDLVHGLSVTHPRVNDSSFYLRPPSRNMKPPWANSYNMTYANMPSQPKQQIEQRLLQVDVSAVQFQHTDTPRLSSEEGHFLQCRQLKREARVSSSPPYSQKRVLIDNNSSVLPQSEGILNGSLQMNGCPRPDQLPLFHHHKDCRDPMCPVCRTDRKNLKRNSQGVTPSEIRPAMAGTPSIGTTDNMPPPKCMKLENTSASLSCQTGASGIPPVVDPSPSPRGPAQVCPVPSTFGREETESRKMNHKVFKSSSTEYRTKLCTIKDSVSEDTAVELGYTPARTNWKNNSQRSVSCGIQLPESATPSIGTICSLPPECRNLDHTSSHPFQTVSSEKSPLTVDQSSPQELSRVCPKMSANASNGSKSRKIDPEPLASSSKESHPELCEGKDGTSDERIKAECGDKPRNSDIVRQLEEENQAQIEFSKRKMELESTIICSSSNGLMLGANSERPKIKALSLIESFSKEEIRDHIKSLRQSDEPENSRKETNHSAESSGGDSPCSLCGKHEIYLGHPPKYCGLCSFKISPKGSFYYVIGNDYYSTYEGCTNTVFCVTCYKRKASTGQIMVGNVGISKSHLVKTWDIDDVAESWVECGRCKAWQHQICALFNDDLNKDDTSGNEYMCPSCLLQDMEDGICMPLPPSMVLSAENLPKTKLSNHLETWLFRSLEKDRRGRANLPGSNHVEVPGLVVRVVSSIDKTLEVNTSFREIFKNEGYPAEFPYKSKAIFLFQKIDGADVCLFGMYVQEFGSECAVPNQRRVCISYLDSVKYFRPEIRAATGEALRTVVYYEILMGYLDYCKQRGFMSCYIWSCPPLNKDDYILYCHPTTQKLPMRQSLQRWYQKLVRKALTETVIVEHANLFDRYFKLPSYCTAKVTASRLPYFDGDWWVGEAEKFLKERMRQKEENGERNAKRQRLSEDTEDPLLMEHMGKQIGPVKTEFILLHFRHSCRHCGEHIVSGSRWVCAARPNFNLCDACYSVEQSRRKSVYYNEVRAESVPADTNDGDENIHSEHVDNRFMLLNLCQKKNYQFDTLRRAKHSTMMILYHLHDERKKQGQQKFWKKMVNLLVHASECPAPRCTYGDCRKLKYFFRHVKGCKIRVKNGCMQCKKVWQILKVHARNCKESECSVPRCRDLKQNTAAQGNQ